MSENTRRWKGSDASRAGSPVAGLLAAAAVAAGLGLGAGPALANVAGDGGTCRAGAETHDPIGLYGDEIVFSVTRNGTPVGEHRVTFERQGDDIIAHTRFHVTVTVLTVPVYRFAYESTDRWRDGCLIELQADIDKNGKRWTISAERDGDMMRIDGPNGTSRTAPLGLFPTNHWHAGVIGADRVLNPLTGSIDRVRIVEVGAATVPVNSERRPARHYAYTGDLNNEVWYDGNGRWVGMRFKGDDGSAIQLTCQSCSRDSAVVRR
jgi:hypothetical protein